jgi:hypothetical protein
LPKAAFWRSPFLAFLADDDFNGACQPFKLGGFWAGKKAGVRLERRLSIGK